MFLMSLAAAAATLGLEDETVCGMGVLGPLEFPLGKPSNWGSGDARVGGEGRPLDAVSMALASVFCGILFMAVPASMARPTCAGSGTDGERGISMSTLILSVARSGCSVSRRDVQVGNDRKCATAMNGGTRMVLCLPMVRTGELLLTAEELLLCLDTTRQWLPGRYEGDAAVFLPETRIRRWVGDVQGSCARGSWSGGTRVSSGSTTNERR